MRPGRPWKMSDCDGDESMVMVEIDHVPEAPASHTQPQVPKLPVAENVRRRTRGATPPTTPAWGPPMVLDLVVKDLQPTVKRILMDNEEELIEGTREVGRDLVWYYLTLSPTLCEDGSIVLYGVVNIENSTRTLVDTRARVSASTKIVRVIGDAQDIKIDEVQRDDWCPVYAPAGTTETMFDFKLTVDENMVDLHVKVSFQFQETKTEIVEVNKSKNKLLPDKVQNMINQMKKEMTTLAESVQQLTKFGIYTPENEDFKVQCSNGEVIGFHKDLLKARGGSKLREELYAKMDQPIVYWKEDEFPESIWKGFKSYIYFGGISDLNDKCQDYFEFAHKYDIDHLKELTEVLMIQKLNEFTFGRYHRVAKTYPTKYLQAKMKMFLMKTSERVAKYIDLSFDGYDNYFYK